MPFEVAFLASADDWQVQRVAEAVEREGGAVRLFDPHHLAEEGRASDLDGQLWWGETQVGPFRSAWVHQLPSLLPTTAQLPPSPEAHFVEAVRRHERAAFVTDWLRGLEAQGTRLINPPRPHAGLADKAFQLQVLRAVGAPVPPTLISNYPPDVRAFAERHGQVICKPLGGGAATALLDQARLERLDDVRASPCIFQARCVGDDVRVVVVDGAVVSAVRVTGLSEPRPLDFRADARYAAGQASYEAVELPLAVRNACLEACRRLGLVLAGLDLKREDSGQFVFLEANAAPAFGDVEAKLGHPIAAAVARALTR